MDDRLYNKINNIMGWGLFGFATMIFMMTLEPTVSFWDCGERISVSYKLQIAHPPGAPLIPDDGTHILFAGVRRM
jgi:hypothetical protein